MRKVVSFFLFLFCVFSSVIAQGVDAEGTLVVLNKADNTASIIDVNTGEELALIPTGNGPHEAAVSLDGMTAVVGDYGDQTPGNSLTIIDLKGLSVKKKIDLGQYTRPHGVEFIDQLRVAVTSESQQKVIVVNLNTGEIEKVVGTEQVASHMVVVDKNRQMAYTANIVPGTVSVLNLKEGKLEENIAVGGGIEGIGISYKGDEIWVANRNTHKVHAISAESRKIIATMDSPDLPFRVKFSPDGKYALIPNANSGDISIFDVKSKELKQKVKLSGLEWKGEKLGAATPVGLITDIKSDYLYVNCLTLSKVAAINLKTFEVDAFFETGNVPDGIAYSPVTVKK